MNVENSNKFKEFVKEFVKESGSKIEMERRVSAGMMLYKQTFDAGFGSMNFIVKEIDNYDEFSKYTPFFKVYVQDYNNNVESSNADFSRYGWSAASHRLNTINAKQCVFECMKEAVGNLAKKTTSYLAEEVKKELDLITSSSFIVSVCSYEDGDNSVPTTTSGYKKLCLKSGKTKEERDKEGVEEKAKLLKEIEEYRDKLDLFDEDSSKVFEEELRADEEKEENDETANMLESWNGFEEFVKYYSNNTDSDNYVIPKNSLLGRLVKSFMKEFGKNIIYKEKRRKNELNKLAKVFENDDDKDIGELELDIEEKLKVEADNSVTESEEFLVSADSPRTVEGTIANISTEPLPSKIYENESFTTEENNKGEE